MLEIQKLIDCYYNEKCTNKLLPYSLILDEFIDYLMESIEEENKILKTLVLLEKTEFNIMSKNIN